jgi:hypothetical protein
MFHVGQDVVCVDDSDTFGAARAHGLCRGDVYSIAGITPSGPSAGYLALGGIISAWNPRRFRPVIKRVTDISIFTEMLTPSKVDA